MHREEMAYVESASAWYGRGTLAVRAAGSLPSRCWRAVVRQSPIEIFPPHFEAVQLRVASICPQVVTPFDVVDSFELGTPVETVTLHHAGGELTLPVESGAGPEGIGVAEDVRYDEATGRARRSLSFGEAFRDALANLPAVETPIADWLEIVEVVSVKAEFGGIDGRSDLVVHVRRPRPPE
jgi:hypothetical protein